MNNPTLYWLAGLLEGEGSFMSGPPSSPSRSVISVQMTDEDIIAKVAATFEVSYFSARPQKSHHKPSYITHLCGKRAVALMLELRPLMGDRRQLQIDNAVAAHHANKKILLTTLNADLIFRCVARGETHSAIAKKIGVERSTITKFLKRQQR